MKHLKKISKHLLIAVFFLQTINLFAQSKVVSGTVTGPDREAIIGASVMVKGTTVGTVTDMDGKYTVKVPDGKSVLVFSYIGHEKQEINIGGKSIVDVELKSASQALDEVVVVGYGTQRKVSLVGSVGSVKSDDLIRTKSSTTATALVGKIPGITNRQTSGQPGASTTLQIRNLGTPLYVIDGVMKDEGQFNNIDINDIESISILKDASAAIYGVKAANGVVLVTTKRGKLNQKVSVNLNAYYGWQKWTYFPKGADAYTLKRAKAEGEINTTGTTSITQDELDKWKAGYYNPATGEDYRSFDWYDYSVHAAPQSYVNVSSSGGSDKINYYMSFSNLDQDAVFEDFNFNRKNFQLNADAVINRSFKVSASMNGRLEKRSEPATNINDVDSKMNYQTLRWGLLMNPSYERPYANDNPNYPAYNENSYLYNPAAATKDIMGEHTDIWRVFQGNWDITYTTPVKGLSAKATYSYYYAGQTGEKFHNGYNLYNYDRENDAYIVAKNTDEDSFLTKYFKGVQENMFRFTINYDNKFGKHAINAVGAAEATEREEKWHWTSLAPVDNNYVSLLKDVGTKDGTGIDETFWETATVGFIGRVNYTYDDRYIVEASGRYDASNKFPKDKRWGFFPSVSAAWRISEESFFKNSKISNVMSNLKLRVSYGEMGDDDGNLLGMNGYEQYTGLTYNSNNAVITPNPYNPDPSSSYIKGTTLKNLPVTNISWINTSIANIGLDLGFFNNKLSVEVDAFKRSRNGLVALREDVSAKMPTEMGLTLPSENLNSDMHIGMDGMVKWTDQVGDFAYSVGVNATFARQKYGETYGQAFGNSWDEYRNKTYKRWSGINWAYEVEGRFKSQEEIDNYDKIMQVSGYDGVSQLQTLLPGDFKYKDLNNDGVINEYDMRPIGYAVGNNGQQLLPNVTFGVNLACSWRGFDLAIDLAGGGMMSYFQDYEVKWAFQSSSGNGNVPAYLIDDCWHRVDPFNPNSEWVEGRYPAVRTTNHHSLSNAYWQSDFWLYNMRYIRIKNLEIGYTLPKKWLEKVYLTNCRVYFNGTNLLSLDNLHHLGLDPEMDERNGMGYPPHKAFTLGINVSF